MFPFAEMCRNFTNADLPAKGNLHVAWAFYLTFIHMFDTINCIGESRPGAYVGGDLFDVVGLRPNALAVAVGDVSGHGVASSVLMCAAQGFLHATCNDSRTMAHRHNLLLPDMGRSFEMLQTRPRITS